MTKEEAEDYAENVRAALGRALLNLSPDRRSLPIDDEMFGPTLTGIVRVLSSLAAARAMGGVSVEFDGLGAELGKQFAETARALEEVFRRVVEQDGNSN